MPHVNDARRLRERAQLLGSPLSVDLQARSAGRRPIDPVEPGQEEFQALLLTCLLSPHRSLSWDGRTGRSFRQMFLYYSWASPRADSLAMGWTVASRVASYLLPAATAPGADGPGFAGIPGLRLASLERKCIKLVHLPTGGRFELHDRMWEDLGMRISDFEMENGGADRIPGDSERVLWTASEVSAQEAAGLAAEWTLAEHAPVLSAVMARIHILWQHWRTGTQLQLGANPVTGLPRLSWSSGPSAEAIGELFTSRASAIRVSGARLRDASTGVSILTKGDSAVELQGPESTSC